MTKEQEQFVKRCQDEGFIGRQLYQIREGFENNLTIKQVSIYAQKEFSWHQMLQISLGLQDGFSLEQVLLYARPELNWLQMREVRYMCYDHESFETIKTKVALMVLES